MDDEEYEYDEYDVAPERRLHPFDFVVLAAGAVAGVTAALSESLTSAYQLAAMHANWLVGRTEFHDQATLELETLMTGDADE